MRTGLRTLGAEPRSIIEAPDTLAQQNPGSGGRPSARLSRIHTARRCVAQERQIGTGERQMRAMILDAPRRPLRAADIPRPEPGPGQVLLAVAACGVCRTDLHVLDGELPNPKVPLILGHEIVGTVTATGGGPGVDRFGIGDRVGGPWPGWRCGGGPRQQGRRVSACPGAGDRDAQPSARGWGAEWAGPSDAPPPEPLDAAIIFAPAGPLVPAALRAVVKGGTVVCAGIHMSDIPAFPYDVLWGERTLRSVANLTRRDGTEFLALAPRVPVRTEIEPHPLERANEALERLRAGNVRGAAVLEMARR